MRWEDERYVRWYIRDTPEWLALSFIAQGLFGLLLRKVDRRGILSLGKIGRRAVAVVIGHPGDWPRLESALDELLADGCVRIDGDRLVVPNFIAAQEAVMSGKLRTAEWRERSKLEELSRDALSPERDEESPDVTRGDATRRGVTPSDPSDPSVPSSSTAAAAAAPATAASIPTAGEHLAARYPHLAALVERLDGDGLSLALPKAKPGQSAQALKGALDQLVARHGVEALVRSVRAEQDRRAGTGAPRIGSLTVFAALWAAPGFQPPAAGQPTAPALEADPGCEDWGRLRQVLAGRLRPDLYGRWFAQVTGKRVNGSLVLTAPNKFDERFLRDNYVELLEQEARRLLGDVTVEVRT